MQHLAGFRVESSFQTWLYQIVTRRALNRIRRARAVSSLDPLDEVSDEDAGPAAEAERARTIDAVSAAVAALPPAQRMAVVLHHFEGPAAGHHRPARGHRAPRHHRQCHHRRHHDRRPGRLTKARYHDAPGPPTAASGLPGAQRRNRPQRAV